MMDFGNESDDEPMSTKMLEDIRDGSQTHLDVNRREARYKIRDSIKQRKSEWNGALKATQSMGKVLHKVFKTVVKYIFCKIYHFWENMVLEFPISFQNLETFLK